MGLWLNIAAPRTRNCGYTFRNQPQKGTEGKVGPLRVDHSSVLACGAFHGALGSPLSLDPRLGILSLRLVGGLEPWGLVVA